MKILVAPTQFKTSLSAKEVAKEIARGIKKGLTGAEIIIKPLADGGEETSQIITQALKGMKIKAKVHGPLSKKIEASFGFVQLPPLQSSPPFLSKKARKVKTAVIEMAAAAGLSRVPESLRNPMNTTTYGVGELILKAVGKGTKQIILGLGDSATNDGGIGALTALGVMFLDKEGKVVKPVGASLKKIASVKISLKDKNLIRVPIFLATDVKNPLLGKNGATQTFASQKGANFKEVEELEKGMKNLAKVLYKTTKREEVKKPGSGAAGGLGFGLSHFLSTTYLSGALLVQEILEVERILSDVQAVFTGEGSFDLKSLKGKAPFLFLKKANAKRIPAFLIAGKISLKEKTLKKLGVKKSISLISLAGKEEESKKNIKFLLRKAAYTLSRELAEKKLKNFCKS